MSTASDSVGSHNDLSYKMRIHFLTAADDVPYVGESSPRQSGCFPHPNLDASSFSGPPLQELEVEKQRTILPSLGSSLLPPPTSLRSQPRQDTLSPSSSFERKMWARTSLPPAYLLHPESFHCTHASPTYTPASPTYAPASPVMPMSETGRNIELSSPSQADPNAVTTYPPTVPLRPQPLPHNLKRSHSSSPEPDVEPASNRRRIDSPAGSLFSERTASDGVEKLVDESTANGWKGRALGLNFDVSKNVGYLNEIPLCDQNGWTVLQLLDMIGEGDMGSEHEDMTAHEVTGVDGEESSRKALERSQQLDDVARLVNHLHSAGFKGRALGRALCLIWSLRDTSDVLDALDWDVMHLQEILEEGGEDEDTDVMTEGTEATANVEGPLIEEDEGHAPTELPADEGEESVPEIAIHQYHDDEVDPVHTDPTSHLFGSLTTEDVASLESTGNGRPRAASRWRGHVLAQQDCIREYE